MEKLAFVQRFKSARKACSTLSVFVPNTCRATHILQSKILLPPRMNLCPAASGQMKAKQKSRGVNDAPTSEEKAAQVGTGFAFAIST